MDKIKSIMLRALWPPAGVTVLLAFISVPALIYTFLGGLNSTAFGFLTYALSTYALATVIVRIPGITAKGYELVKRTRFGNRYISSPPFRAVVSLYTSLAINLAFAIFKLAMGILYASFWFGAVAIYYGILCIVRFLLVRHIRKGDGELQREYRQYRLCGYTQIAISIALSGVVYQLVHQGKTYHYPGLLIYAAATYAFYSMTMAVINLIKRNRLQSPALSASKALGFSTALVAILTLQTALLTTFGSDAAYAQIMNTISGTVVCLVTFSMGVFMVIYSSGKIKQAGGGLPADFAQD